MSKTEQLVMLSTEEVNSEDDIQTDRKRQEKTDFPSALDLCEEASCIIDDYTV